MNLLAGLLAVAVQRLLQTVGADGGKQIVGVADLDLRQLAQRRLHAVLQLALKLLLEHVGEQSVFGDVNDDADLVRLLRVGSGRDAAGPDRSRGDQGETKREVTRHGGSLTG